MMVTTLMVTEAVTPLTRSEAIRVRGQDPAALSVMQAWQWAITQGRTAEASALRRILDGFEEEPTQADAEWQ